MKLRQDVSRLLSVDPDKVNGHGGDRKSEEYKNQALAQSLKAHGDNDYINYRLKRDYPDLAERVFTSELSPHKAGQIAGFY